MRVFILALVLTLVGAACARDTAEADLPGTSTSTVTTTTRTTPGDPPTPTTTTIPPSTIPPTTTPIDLPVAASITIDGPEEVVFDWTTDRCDDEDIPDLPARAFRDSSGTVNLLATHATNLRSIGKSLDDVARVCDPVFKSARNPDPAMFSDYEWIASLYTDDGDTVYGLVHNEYHGWERGDCAGGDNFRCWYNAITSVVSTDGGKTFGYPVDPPGHLVASLPYQYEADTAAVGLFSPSNIVRGPDGLFYALAKVGANGTGAQTVCLMRTKRLGSGAEWTFWTGTSFVGTFVNPYPTEPTNPEENVCPPLALDQIGAQMIESLTFNTFLDQYVLVGISADQLDGREVWGFYYSFSKDLINWTKRELLMEMSLPWTVADAGSDVSHLYPSLLDPDSTSMSFETTGETPYLYFTRNNAGHGSLDRDLIRIPVRFTRTP